MFLTFKDWVELIITSVLLLVIVVILSCTIVGMVKADAGDTCTSSSFCYCEDHNLTPMCILNPVGTLGHCVCL